MNFHTSEDFADAIEATAVHWGMRPVFIEKDYWVTFVLKNLSNSTEYSTTVFKGGTSLSKVYNCIHRFSEDIDLAIITTPGQSQMQVKKQMKAVDIVAAKGLALLDDPPPVRRGKNRFSSYKYSSVLEEGHLVTKPYLRLEVSAFTKPIPHQEVQLQSYIGDYLAKKGFVDIASDFGLEPFNVLVLSIERTFSEKLLSLIRLSYEGSDFLRKKIRHFHDLAILSDRAEIKNMLNRKDYSILNSAYQDDKKNSTFQGAWTESAFHAAPLFSDFSNIWKEIQATYHEELSELSWADEIPSDAEIRKTIDSLREFVSAFDQ